MPGPLGPTLLTGSAGHRENALKRSSSLEGNILEPPNDFRELLGLFNSNKVEYLIAGSYALAFHGAPRFTGDLDIYIRPTPQNAGRIMSALKDFGFGNIGLTAGDFLTEGRIIQLGMPPVRVDLITSLDGLSWEQSESGSVKGIYGGITVRYLGRAEFVANKRAVGRPKDIADVEELGEAPGR